MGRSGGRVTRSISPTSFSTSEIALLFNALWPFVLLIPLIGLFEWGVIRREERYLLAKFGEPYRAYYARVRRWL